MGSVETRPRERDTRPSMDLARALSFGLRLLALLLVLSVPPDEAAAAPPTFPSATPTRTVAEDAAPGSDIGAAVAATDPDSGQTLTYTLGGTDVAKFDIDSATGQLRTKEALDFETSSSHTVTVTATDDGSTPESATAMVTISVTDVAPGLTGPATASYAEGVKGRRAATYTVSDGDTWSLTGTDASAFSITGGFLRFTDAPDHESPADSDTDNIYDVTVQVSDGTTTETQAVKVTVTDVNEPGAVTLSASAPKLGQALTASVSDDDTPTSVTWRWERSNGRLSWETVAGATAAMFTPTAAEAGRLLRATASYTDDHGAGQSATAATGHAVLALRLSSLAMTTTGSGRAMYPAFDADTLHYAAECATGTWTMTLSAEDTTTRLAVDGVQQASTNATVQFSGLDRERDIEIELADSSGARTTYVVHCFSAGFPTITAEDLDSNGRGDLVLFTDAADPEEAYLVLADRNGVPRVRKFDTSSRVFLRFFDDAAYPYAYASNGWNLLDKDFTVARDGLKVVAPISHTGIHDFRLLPNGDYLFMSYNPSQRDFGFLTTDYGIQKVEDEADDDDGIRPCRTGDTGCEDWSLEDTQDSAIQLQTSGGTARLTWNSWGNMAIEDCLTHRFPNDYGHVNSLHWKDSDIIASFRGCNKVLSIDSATGNVEWRVGRSMWSKEEWEAGRSSGAGPAPLAVVGDPHGEFCGQHAASLLPNGNLLLYDNGVNCFVNPVTEASFRQSDQFSRAVEYALDITNGEAVFQRHHSLHNAFSRIGYSAGHVEALDNGDWLITWGHPGPPGSPAPPDVSVTQVDPRTNEEKFSLTVATASGGDVLFLRRAVAVPPVAVAAKVEPLTSQIVRSDSSHTGPTSGPQVVVAFNQPVVDPVADTPSVSVTGATVASVAAHREAGVAANAFVFTLEPAGDGTIRFQLVSARACSAKGICTAAGGTLSAATVPVYISGPSSPRSPPPSGGDTPGGGGVGGSSGGSSDGSSGGGGGGGGGVGGSSGRDRHGNSAARATPIAFRSTTPRSGSLAGRINTQRDVDYFRLRLAQAGVLLLETNGSTDTRGTVWQAGEALGAATGGGPGTNFRLATPVEAGNVVIAVAGEGGRTGGYTLRARLVVGSVENPTSRSFQSGLGLISGWVCEAEGVTIEIEQETGEVVELAAAYGTERADTADVCGDTDNGFGVLFNWNLLGDGDHVVRVLVNGAALGTRVVPGVGAVPAVVDGIELGWAAMTVTTLGAEFVEGLQRSFLVEDFPRVGEQVRVVWQESQQNFVLAPAELGATLTPAQVSSAVEGVLENPRPASYQSGIGVISGWVCEADEVVIEIDGQAIAAAAGTERGDTLDRCGDVDNGFGLLVNWAEFGAGAHEVVALVDGVELSRATVTVTVVDETDPYVRGLAKRVELADFPTPDETVTLEWQEAQQNFVITGVD